MRIVLLLITVFCACCSSVMARTDFDSSELSADGRAAYQTLRSAMQFTIGPAGFGGFSKEEVALRTLLKEKLAAEACLSLVNSANHEGGLYGLLGLHLLKSDMFESALAADARR